MRRTWSTSRPRYTHVMAPTWPYVNFPLLWVVLAYELGQYILHRSGRHVGQPSSFTVSRDMSYLDGYMPNFAPHGYLQPYLNDVSTTPLYFPSSPQYSPIYSPALQYDFSATSQSPFYPSDTSFPYPMSPITLDSPASPLGWQEMPPAPPAFSEPSFGLMAQNAQPRHATPSKKVGSQRSLKGEVLHGRSRNARSKTNSPRDKPLNHWMYFLSNVKPILRECYGIRDGAQAAAVASPLWWTLSDDDRSWWRDMTEMENSWRAEEAARSGAKPRIRRVPFSTMSLFVTADKVAAALARSQARSRDVGAIGPCYDDAYEYKVANHSDPVPSAGLVESCLRDKVQASYCTSPQVAFETLMPYQSATTGSFTDPTLSEEMGGSRPSDNSPAHMALSNRRQGFV